MTDVSELKDLVNTAEQSQFPDCDLFQQLKAAVAEAERCASVALQLVSRKHRTRYNDIEFCNLLKSECNENFKQGNYWRIVSNSRSYDLSM